MALLDQLHIQGIRNFPPDKTRVVRFQYPLTLIVGENGCGKTTVIECIKFALTNEYPSGAASGKNFVHDPRVGKKDETHAIVKLQCVCENKDTVCVVRTLLLTNKNDKETCVSKDTTISRKNPMTGEQRNLGCLQTESVTEMCNIIGVSKAILNNVIFCHQENSDWPLGEGKKVKEIFDEIFDTTKYNKAMDAIKAQRDRLRKEVPTLKTAYEAALNYKKEADSKKQLIYNNNQKREQSMQELHNIDEKMKPLMEGYHELQKKSLNISKRTNQYDNKKTERDIKLENCKKLEASIKQLFNGDRSELEEKVKNFESRLLERRAYLKEQSGLKNQHIQEEKQMHSRINEVQVRLGKLERDEETQNKLNDNLKTKLNNLADTLSLNTAARALYTQEEAGEVLNTSQETIDRHLSDITILERTFADQEKDDQVKIDSLRESKATLESQIKHLNERIASNKKETNNVITQINEVTHSQSTLQTLQAKLNRVNSQIEELSQEMNPETVKSDIDKWKVERTEMEDELTTLENEITYLQAQNITLAEIKSLKAREETKLADVQNLKSKHNDAFVSLFGIVPEENFKISLNETLKSNTHDIKKKQKEINGKEKALCTLEANVSNEEKKHKELLRTLAEYQDSLDLVLDGKNFEDELDRVTLELKREQEEVSMLASTEYMFNRYIDKLNESQPCCPLCKRGFESEYSVSGLVNDLKTKIENIPRDTANGKARLDRLAKQQSNLQGLRPVFKDVCQLKEAKIPAIELNISELKEKLVEAKNELSKLKTALEAPTEKETLGQTLRGDVAILDQNIKDLKNIQRELEKQESKISGNKVTELNLDQALERQKERRNELGILRDKLDDSQTKLSAHNEKMRSLEKQKNEIHAKQLTIQGGAGMLKSLEDRKAELHAEDTKYQAEKEEVTAKIAPIETQLKLAMSELETLKKEHKIKLKEERQKIQKYTQQLEEVKRIKQDVLNYLNRGILAQLTEVRDTLNTLTQSKDEIVARRTNCESIINETNIAIGNQSIEKIDLEKSMDLIDKKQELARLDEEVEALFKDIKELDSETIDKQLKEAHMKKQGLLNDEAKIQGKIQEIDEIIKITENDLKKDYLKNADQKFLRYAYKLKLTNIMMADLANYHGTLEQCIVKYHEKKMQSINDLIRDYWTRVYQGNDIHYIKIVAEVAGSIDKRRVYSTYRVVQLKNGTEQDMRNRCSAGQRVLACLIIRLALAETFSRNCGIFALDEPTTNLDSKNAMSLSKALTLLVEEKKEQKNFQLIVITHDEDFIEQLTAIDKAYVVRITRDHNGLSNVQYPENMVSREIEKEETDSIKPNFKKMRTEY